MPGKTKADIIAELTALGVTTCFGAPLLKMSVVELEALLEAQSLDEEEQHQGDKLKKDPMSGLDRFSRKELEQIVSSYMATPP